MRAAREEPCDGSPEAISSTSRGKSSGPPGVGSAHTSSSRKSRVSSWIRQGQLSAWAWLRSWIGARQMLFAWDDPVPGFARILRSLWIAGTRKLGRSGAPARV